MKRIGWIALSLSLSMAPALEATGTSGIFGVRVAFRL
jgi:hypothetical protein